MELIKIIRIIPTQKLKYLFLSSLEEVVSCIRARLNEPIIPNTNNTKIEMLIVSMSLCFNCLY